MDSPVREDRRREKTKNGLWLLVSLKTFGKKRKTTVDFELHCLKRLEHMVQVFEFGPENLRRNDIRRRIDEKRENNVKREFKSKFDCKIVRQGTNLGNVN